MKNKSKAYKDRSKLYSVVEKIHTYNNRFGTVANSIYQVENMKVLAKVFLICLIQAQGLKDHRSLFRLYDSATYIYLRTFKKITDGTEYNRQMVIDIRKAYCTVERCIDFIKLDYPHLFNYDLIQEGRKNRKKPKEGDLDED